MKSAILAFFLCVPAFGAGSWIGQKRALVLTLEWAGETSPVTREEVESTFFSERELSLNRYFLENSQGKFQLTGEVKEFKRLKRSWDAGRLGCDPTAIADIAWAEFQGEIDPADFDSDKDGKIDHLFVVHSGRMPSDRVGPNCMFSYRTNLANELAVFQASGVGSVGTAIPIGFYIHEAGHYLFGFPDLYSDHYHGRYGVGMWGMMGLGCWGVNNSITSAELFRYPAHFEPLSKVRIGWIEPRIIAESTMAVRLRPVELSGDIVAVPIGQGRSRYYLEYRSPTGFSAGHRGHGLLIWKDFELIQADGRDDLNNGRDLGRRPLPPIDENFGDDSDPFPGSLNVTRYEDRAAGLSVENIREENGEIVFDIVRSAPTPAAIQIKAPWHMDFRRDW